MGKSGCFHIPKALSSVVGTDVVLRGDSVQSRERPGLSGPQVGLNGVAQVRFENLPTQSMLVRKPRRLH